MRIASIDHRATLIIENGEDLQGVDIEKWSNGKFPSSTRELLPHLDELRTWVKDHDSDADIFPVSWDSLESPITDPRQIFAIGMNYQAHAEEVAIAAPEVPAVFTKFATSLSGARKAIKLPSDSVDWEIELVAIIGRGGRNISREDALDHIAGYAVGQDLSDRALQFAASSSPQFSLGKSHAGFAPVGPWMTTSDEVADPGQLKMRCAVGEEVLQDGSTANLIFDIPTLVEHLSSVVELAPGDLIFTGTPDGVGFGRNPKRYLRTGEELVSTIEGLGEIRQLFS
ncbi:UNVERIFIED_ORG: 2-keto-4-pentenoate hydratase/2-oxohepta-3-ene-1,7-dioic acid hydratase in catechol pathway [Arthrobacter globiformis]|nr:2-keto-4-pentenoate hydratase/2-oxohepta-3-ene-1,7-dioic acid hydratase in catechol pathway [Arthrobacter globiformis]